MYTYRCTRRRCRRRQSFRRRPAAHRLRCKRCGGDLHCVKKSVLAWNRRQQTCHCGLIPYPHREGSAAYHTRGRWAGMTMVCQYHPEFDPYGSGFGAY